MGYAYIPWQQYWRQYSPEEANEKGTLFPELYSPYYSDRCPPVVPIPYMNDRPPMLRKKK
ncbi:MAG: spore coat associated protein CotJA [Firmicutes bacterium]|nr:spore coat associated protein CotJA [Bacillota bacterium]